MADVEFRVMEKASYRGHWRFVSGWTTKDDADRIASNAENNKSTHVRVISRTKITPEGNHSGGHPAVLSEREDFESAPVGTIVFISDEYDAFTPEPECDPVGDFYVKLHPNMWCEVQPQNMSDDMMFKYSQSEIVNKYD